MDLFLHEGQREIFDDTHRFRVCVTSRRFGKSFLLINELLIAALNFPGTPSLTSPETVLGAMPTLQMARGIIWQPLVSLCQQDWLRPYVRNIDRSNFRISFYGKPDIKISGANDRNGDGLRGMRIYFAACDEAQDFRPDTFDKVIVPAMADTPGSRALITGTPKGQLNVLYDLYQRQLIDPTLYKSFNFPIWSNPLIPTAFIEQQRLILPPRVFAQEMCGDFVTFASQIYSELCQENLVAALPSLEASFYDTVIMGVDFGDVNPGFCVVGSKRGVWFWLEGWQGFTGLPVAQPEQDIELVRLAKRWQPKAVYCDPSRPSAILGIRALGKQYDLPGLRKAIAGYNPIAEGIGQLHSLIFQRRLMYASESAIKPGHIYGKDAYDRALSYHYLTDRQGLVTQRVEDNQDDHAACDALRYALAVPNPLAY